jgi:phosphoglycerate kinase
MKTLKDLDLTGQRVLIRVDFNVPLDAKGRVSDDTRIKAVLPTVNLALEKGGRVILASHLGRPKGRVMPAMSLAPVARVLSELLGRPVAMAADCIGPEVEKQVAGLANGQVLMLENLRFHPEEEKDDEGFARSLAGLCDIYINDAFAVSHRANASVSAVVGFAPKTAAGLLLFAEMDYFEKAMADPKRPLVAVVGGAKVSGKLAVLENLLQRVDKLVVGGAMANTFLKSQGIDVGRSKIEAELVDTAARILQVARTRGVRFYLPVDAVVAEKMEASAATRPVPVNEIPEQAMVLDIGPATALLYAQVLADALTIVWNGPMGVFEIEPFAQGTMAVAKAMADSKALTIVGGGDTDAAVHRAGVADRMSFISTGGGAFLELLEGKTLPGIAALQRAGASAAPMD